MSRSAGGFGASGFETSGTAGFGASITGFTASLISGLTGIGGTEIGGRPRFATGAGGTGIAGMSSSLLGSGFLAGSAFFASFTSSPRTGTMSGASAGPTGSNTGPSAGFLAFASSATAGDGRDRDGQLELLALGRARPGRGCRSRSTGEAGLTVRFGQGARLLGGVGLGGRVGGEHGQPADPDGQRAGQHFPAVQAHGLAAPRSGGGGPPMRPAPIPPAALPCLRQLAGPSGPG